MSTASRPPQGLFAPVELAQEGVGSQLWAKAPGFLRAPAGPRRSQRQTQTVSSSQRQHRRLTGGDGEPGLARHTAPVPVPAQTPSPYVTSLQLFSSAKWAMDDRCSSQVVMG